MLIREAEASAIMEKIEILVRRLDDSSLKKTQTKPLIYEVITLFEQLIQLRAELKKPPTYNPKGS